MFLTKRKTQQPSITVIAMLFFMSGVAALIYQIVWQRGLTLHYGVGTHSITLIVSVFMAGLGLGALIGGYVAERVKDQLRLYFLIEISIGLFGLISLPFLDWIGGLTAGSDLAVAALSMALFLSLPTLLMGMTLPLLVKIYNAIRKDFLDSVSMLYFINTLGGAVGALLAAYLLITFYGLDGALYGAVIINVLLAVGIYWVMRSIPQASNNVQVATSPIQRAHMFAYALVFVMGFLAIGYELVWFRLVGVLVKSSPYAFASTLSVYLVGIALGSYLMHRLLRVWRPNQPLHLLLMFQGGVAISAGVMVVLFTWLGDGEGPVAGWIEISFDIPLHPMLFGNAETGPLASHLRAFSMSDLWLWSSWFVLLPTLLMGASFPLINEIARRGQDREAESVAWVYCFNVLGNMLGGIVTGFWLLEILGTESTLQIFVVTGALIWLLNGRSGLKNSSFITVTMAVCLVAVLATLPSQGALYSLIHKVEGYEGASARRVVTEGRDGVVVTHQQGNRLVTHINGLAHGGRPGVLIYPQVNQLLAKARKLDHVLIIGFGTGTTTELLLRSPRVKKVTLVELNQTLLDNLRQWKFFNQMLNHPKLDLVVDDGRRYLLRTSNSFDAVIMDPLRTTTAYSNNLYSMEFYRLVAKRLNPGHGLLLAWADERKTTLATLGSVFASLQAYSVFDEEEDDTMFVLSSVVPDVLTPEAVSRVSDPIFNSDERRNLIYLMSNTQPVSRPADGTPFNQDLKPINEYYLRSQLKRFWNEL